MPSLRHLLTEHPTLLLIDAASTRVQVGLWHQDLVSWQIDEAEAGTAVFSCTEKLLAERNLTIADLNAYIFCEGPGSVLGIRTSAVALRTWRVLNPAPPTPTKASPSPPTRSPAPRSTSSPTPAVIRGTSSNSGKPCAACRRPN